MSKAHVARKTEKIMAAWHMQKQKAREQAGGEMAIEATETDAEHSCGQLSERGKQVWRSGSGMNGEDKE